MGVHEVVLMVRGVVASHLLGNDGQHLQFDAVELIEARPGTRGRKALQTQAATTTSNKISNKFSRKISNRIGSRIHRASKPAFVCEGSRKTLQ